ncbi:MAG: hypothetical protein JXR03_06910 [Cyclobacteriaceae bacterium]
MISAEEKKYLYFLTSSYWKGEGNIVEIGPWLGGSTYCLASGLSTSKHYRGQKIYVYDNFIWREFMGLRANLELNDNDDFLPFFKENLKDYSDYIVAFKESLPDESVPNDKDALTKRQLEFSPSELIHYDSKEKVEILFIDGAKSWSGTRYLLEVFHHSLIPNTTLLVCQDYKYWGCYWVIMIFEILKDKMEIEHILPYNSVSFKLTQPISKEDISNIPSLDEIDIDLGISMIKKASQRIGKLDGIESSVIIELNAVKFLAHKGEEERAHRYLIDLISWYPFYKSKEIFKPIVNWFAKSYDQKIDLKDSLYWKLRTVLASMYRKLRS